MWRKIVLVSVGLIAGCGTPAENNVVVINNDDGTSNGTSDTGCLAMTRAIARSDGTSCAVSECEVIPCACADGSTVSSSSCANDICLATQACQRACGTVAQCDQMSPNNDPDPDPDPTPNNVNQMPGSDSGMQGDACTCEDTSSGVQDDRYKLCSGTEDGCAGLFGPLECIWNLRSKAGTCRVDCSEGEFGTQGPCPNGSVCSRFPSIVHDELNPNYFHACD